MPIWQIILYCIAGILLFILIGSVTLYLSYDEKMSLRVGIWGLKFWIINPDKEETEEEKEQKKKKETKSKTKSDTKSQKKSKKKSAKNAKKETAAEKTKELADGKGKKNLWDTIYLVLDLIKAVLPPTGNLLSHLRITALRLKLSVGKEEAKDTAMLYGEMNGALYYTLAMLQSRITVKVKKWEIHADFVTGETVWQYSFKVKLRTCLILGAAIRMLFRYLVNTIKRKNEQTKLVEATPQTAAQKRTEIKRKKDGAVL